MALKKSQRSLKKWTKQDWGYITKSDSKKPRKKRGRYLPKSVRANLTKRRRGKYYAISLWKEKNR